MTDLCGGVHKLSSMSSCVSSTTERPVDNKHNLMLASAIKQEVDSGDEDTEGYDVDDGEVGGGRLQGTERAAREVKEQKICTSTGKGSWHPPVDPLLTSVPRSGKRKTRLENILHRLLVHQDDEKTSPASAICETSTLDSSSTLDSGREERLAKDRERSAISGGDGQLPHGRRKGRRTVREPSRKSLYHQAPDGHWLLQTSDTSDGSINPTTTTTATERSLPDNDKTTVSVDTTHHWWTCFLCSIPFSDASAMLSHMQEHREVLHYPCGRCDDKFTSLDSLGKHLDSHLQQVTQRCEVHPCHLCGKSFSSLSHLVRHLAAHGGALAVKQEEGGRELSVSSKLKIHKVCDGETETSSPGAGFTNHHRCSRCRRTFATSDALQLHKCRKGLVKPFGCARCGRCFTQFSNLKEHAMIHDTEMTADLECYECGMKFMYSIELRRHVSTHIKSEQALSVVKGSTASQGEGQPPVPSVMVPKRRSRGGKRKRPPMTDANQCKVCGKFFPQRSYLHLHMQTHKEKRFACQYCDKKFTFKKSLEIHVRTHTGEKPYQCDLCPRQFTRQDALHKHRRIHLGVKPYVCDICGRQFGDSFELRRHINAHNHEKPYKCNLCDKAYSDNTRLKEHMFRHTGNMPYICEKCGKGFARKYRYNLHMSQHAGEVKFSCETCGRGFLRRSDYNTHLLTHTVERPFKCRVCGMGFVRDYYLKRHELVHSGEKPFTCEICGRDFKRKNTLNRHVLTHSKTSVKVSASGDVGYKLSSQVHQDTDRTSRKVGRETASRGQVTHHDGTVSCRDGTVNCSDGTVSCSDETGSGSGGTVSGGVVEERDIMRDIQAVIGVSVASMFSEVM